MTAISSEIVASLPQACVVELPVKPLVGVARRHPNTTSRDGVRGQALVEFALITPVMLVLLLLAVDFGRLFFSYIAVNNAAREATYFAAVSAGKPTFELSTFQGRAAAVAAQETNVQSQGGAGALDISTPSCFSLLTGVELDCHEASDYADGIGNHVSVSVSQPFTFLTPIVGDIFGGQLTLSASATGPVLNPAGATILASSTPTPTPTPPPSCTVPDFYHTYFYDIGALTIWHDEAGFTGTLIDNSGGKKIQHQTLAAGSSVLCSSSMIVSNN